MNLERFFEVQFDDPNINRQQLRKFTEDHLKRLAINNDKNLYDLILTNTQAVYERYFGALNDVDVSNALQQSRTVSMDNVKTLFQTTTSRREGLISNYFDTDSAEYQEFFPHGLTEYSNATLENVETLMSRMVTASSAHVDILGSALVTEFTNIQESFLSARGKQLEQKGVVSKASKETEGTRAEVEKQLTENLLTIALHNIGNKKAAAMYFDGSIIARPEEDEDTPEDTPPQV